MHKRIHRTLAAIMILILLIVSSGCAAEETIVHVTWLDADGSILAVDAVAEDFDPTSRPLPEDSNDWHYTGWQLTHSGAVAVCSATRVANRHFVWKDFDGSVLHEAYFPEDEEAPGFDLPQNSEKWEYIEWNQTGAGLEVVFEAEREPNKEYFSANVFQIILKDEAGEVLGSGSGFVINKDGWFITNDHVMNGGHSAVAFFDIKDAENGQQYTQLNVIGGAYHDAKKDIFIGKLEGYYKISQYYNDIPFTEEYAQGDPSYSVGYPNSSTKMQINPGVILEEYSDIHSKIQGIYYVLSDSYIAPGSSGGILVNENFEVVGITTMGFYADNNKQHYTSGGSIPYFVFKQVMTQFSIDSIQPLYQMYKTEI